MRKGFIFDQNKCVGCHACVVACQIENNSTSILPWRSISTYNQFQFSSIPLFHFSLACNHCEDAPCMTGCPALAYSRDPLTHAVVHHQNSCIGCKYCTWLCPYDAPKYSYTNGVIEKCTLCEDRLKNDLKPACANLCPTGALDYDEIGSYMEYSGLDGFPEKELDPAIKIIPLRKEHILPEIDRLDETSRKRISEKIIKPIPGKVNMRNEWMLVIFSIMSALMVGLMYANFFNDFPVNPWIFMGSGCIIGLLTFLHLGKKVRAWRSVLNIKESWLSREILSFGVFIILSGIFIIKPFSIIIGPLAVLSGFYLLYTIDRVYRVGEKTTSLDVHSASVLLTGIFFAALITGNEYIIWPAGIIKLALYIYRKAYFLKKGKNIRLGLLWLRLVLGFLLPLFIYLISGKEYVFWLFICILIAEIIDRVEFYLDFEIMSPTLKIQQDLK